MAIVPAVLVAAALLAVPAAPVPYAPPGADPRGSLASRPVPAGLPGLVELAVQRLLLADAVAAAKFGGGGPITDPARERELLGSVATRSARIGLAPEAGTRFFRAQIEAAKAVQRGLHARWRAHPELRPRERPDLATEVRPRLDLLTPRLLRLLKQTEPARARAGECRTRLALAGHAAETRDRLDGLHRDALTLALAPVCP
ncbi:gamma subclass chorismate mutase AroQ [Nonomuraea jiangxiensis]|uniref:chorismate mutase n=1 Tax=Nonomuraea jiangxiensis TaxID=633440 RepID=A0A1G8I2P3_9ACTN|nr:gamma subclass chorismate mutase AroQ [Nonomuraea jiangxiensis]SDI13001.1 chorismate mutase [Nonomuraea jiangxiensis]